MSVFRCGFVAVCGRPNAGKSTLVNRLAGGPVSIVTPKAQTTRNRITGIRNGPGSQIIFVDTPGLITGAGGMNEYLMKTAHRAILDADAVICVLDAVRKRPLGDIPFFGPALESGKPLLLALNKVDALRDKTTLLPVMEAAAQAAGFAAVVPVSAVRGDGLDRLALEAENLLPEGDRLFPEDLLSDMPEKFFVSEIIREAVFLNLREELPYSAAVLIETFDETGREGGLVKIAAAICVERTSQKGMAIGRGGAMLKKIGTEARKGIERFLGAKVFLELHVKVSRNWTRDHSELKRLGYFIRSC
jgi:GTP-binding protein Era